MTGTTGGNTTFVTMAFKKIRSKSRANRSGVSSDLSSSSAPCSQDSLSSVSSSERQIKTRKPQSKNRKDESVPKRYHPSVHDLKDSFPAFGNMFEDMM